jgi:hypothetical protein
LGSFENPSGFDKQHAFHVAQDARFLGRPEGVSVRSTRIQPLGEECASIPGGELQLYFIEVVFVEVDNDFAACKQKTCWGSSRIPPGSTANISRDVFSPRALRSLRESSSTMVINLAENAELD